MKYAMLDTPLGKMIAAGDKEKLYFLEFAESESKKYSEKTSVIESIEKELKLYFQGKLQHFKTPLALSGTSFQKKAWFELQKIPYGTTCSYSNLAAAIGRPKSFRAAAQANKRNKFAIIVPCHRVINSDGTLGGYFSGLERKTWLLNHEASMRFHGTN